MAMAHMYFFYYILYTIFLLFFFFTLQYCIGFAIHQHESTTGPWLTYFNNFLGNVNSVTQSCPTFCYPMDCNPPGSSVHGISKARILGWVVISFPTQGSNPCHQGSLRFQNNCLKKILKSLSRSLLFYKDQNDFI